MNCPRCDSEMTKIDNDYICSSYPFCTGRVYAVVINTCGRCGKEIKRKQNVTHCPECIEKLRVEYGFIYPRKIEAIRKCIRCGNDAKWFKEGMCKKCYVGVKKVQNPKKQKYVLSGIKAIR